MSSCTYEWRSRHGKMEKQNGGWVLPVDSPWIYYASIRGEIIYSGFIPYSQYKELEKKARNGNLDNLDELDAEYMDEYDEFEDE